MRKEYDFSNGERGKFYRKVDTANPLIENDDKEFSLKISQRISNASEVLDEIALSK